MSGQIEKKSETHLKWRPDVKGNLLLHYDVQEPSLLLVLDSATWGLNFLLQLAAPLPSIWKMKTSSMRPKPKCTTVPVLLLFCDIPGKHTWQCVSVKVVLISSILCTPSPQRSLTVTSFTFCFQSTNTSENGTREGIWKQCTSPFHNAY